MTGRVVTGFHSHRVPLVLLVVYTLFLFLVLPWRGIQWGDGLEFVAVSSHLGVAHPPGYPLYTVLGWLFLWTPASEPYHAMVALNRVALLPIVACFYLVTRRLIQLGGGEHPEATRLALLMTTALGVAPFMLSQGHLVEVYAMHGALVLGFVAAVLLPLRSDASLSPRALAIAATLLGLAFSHHLTAAAFAPLFLVVFWQSTKANRAAWWSLAIVAIIPVLAFLSIPLRIPSDPNAHGIYWNNPREFSAVIDHLRGGEYRQFQFLQMQPGVPFTIETYVPFLGYRLLQMLSALGAVFFGEGPTAALAGVLIAGFAVAGFWQNRNLLARYLLVGLLIALALQIGFILTYNIPDVADYFFALFLVLLPFAFAGFLRACRQFLREKSFSEEKLRVVATGISSIFLAATLAQHLAPKGEIDIKELPSLWRDRVLSEIPEGAAVITSGDVDVYTLWYEQFARSNRGDILVYGANFVRFPWFRQTLSPADPRRGAVSFRPAPPTTLQAHIDALRACAIEPLLAEGPVFTTIIQQVEIDALSRFYRLEPVASLLTESEFVALVGAESLYIPPPVLYEIRRRDGP